MNFSKASFIQVIVVVVAITFFVASTCSIASTSIEVKRIDPMDDAIIEEWTRVIKNEDILGVSASKYADGDWHVFINVAEFIREEPLESKLHQRITDSLAGIDGVVEVIHEDREVWLVRGDVTGEALVRSSSAALNELHEELATTVDSL